MEVGSSSCKGIHGAAGHVMGHRWDWGGGPESISTHPTEHHQPRVHLSTPNRASPTKPLQPQTQATADSALHHPLSVHGQGWEQLRCTTPGKDQPFYRPPSSSSTPASEPKDLEMSCSGLTVPSYNRLDHPPTSIMGFFVFLANHGHYSFIPR